MPDEPTVGELARLIQGMRRDNEAQFRGIRDEIRQLVSVEYLALHEKLLAGRIDALARDIGEEAADRKNDISNLRGFLRWLTMATIAGVGVVVSLVLVMRTPS